MKRHTPLNRTAQPIKRSRETRSRRTKRKPMDKDLREAVYVRSGGMCDSCGQGMHPSNWDAHHRQARGMGNAKGADTMENLIALHGDCHHYAHEHPAWARQVGLIVPSWGDPATTPVLRHQRTWELPTEHGWEPTTPPRNEDEQ